VAQNWNRAGGARVARAGEGIGGRSREGLTAGPHVAVSEREEKWAADTWDREGTGVHLVVAHKERERWRSGLAMRVGSGPAH
jgi:hypothetical protein